MKRKFEEPLDFDENGNWTLETARAKLQDFFAINGKDLVFKEQESGTLQDRKRVQFSMPRSQCDTLVTLSVSPVIYHVIILMIYSPLILNVIA